MKVYRASCFLFINDGRGAKKCVLYLWYTHLIAMEGRFQGEWTRKMSGTACLATHLFIIRAVPFLFMQVRDGKLD